MYDLATPISRRRFLAASAGGILAASLPVPLTRAGEDHRADISFFLIGDTHYLADKEDPHRLDPRSQQVTTALIDTLNRLPGTAITEAAGGGTVRTPAGVIHAGDIIDSGDKAGATYGNMQQREWDAFVADFGLTGKDGRLKYPVFELHGNHDGPGGHGIPIDGIVARNKSRLGLANVAPNGLHYSWDWGDLHLLCLGIVVGQVESVPRKRRYDPLKSLDFLIDDLKSHVGDSGRPIIITHHVDVARYSLPCDANAPFANHEWDPCDVHAFHEAIKPFNVIGVFYGHTHARNIYSWDGTPKKAADGISVYNVAKASHFNSETQAIFYVEVTSNRLTVRELATRNRWADAEWTPQVWSKLIQPAGA